MRTPFETECYQPDAAGESEIENRANTLGLVHANKSQRSGWGNASKSIHFKELRKANKRRREKNEQAQSQCDEQARQFWIEQHSLKFAPVDKHDKRK